MKTFETTFLSHMFRNWHQVATLKTARSNLKEGEIYIVMDFSQDYTCKFGRKIQSLFYGALKSTLGLHTGVVYNSGEVRQNHRSFFDTSKPLGRVVVWTLNFRSEMVAAAGSRA